MDEFKIRVVPRPWNKGKLVGQKAPLKLKEIWAIRVRLQVFCRTRELALFDLGIDSKLRACDLVKLQVRDIAVLGHDVARAPEGGVHPAAQMEGLPRRRHPVNGQAEGRKERTRLRERHGAAARDLQQCRSVE